jgi:hypothetical protein
MSATISLTQTQILTALVSVLSTFGLLGADGNAVPIIRGQINRVPEPTGQDFIALWPIIRGRLAMNEVTAVDSSVTASITDDVMDVTELLTGSVLPGASIYGDGVTAGCQVIAQLTGSPAGGVGTYSTSATANVSAETLYCGTTTSVQETELTMQADVHGPAAADNVARITTLWRDQFSVDAFQVANLAISPLYASEPRQIPFDNGEQQVEERWVIDLCMQANIGITTTQQFADELKATVQPVNTL